MNLWTTTFHAAGTKSLMKWKGVILAGGEGGETEQQQDDAAGTGRNQQPLKAHHSSASGTSRNSNSSLGAGATTSDDDDPRGGQPPAEQITTAIKPNNAINLSGYKVREKSFINSPAIYPHTLTRVTNPSSPRGRQILPFSSKLPSPIPIRETLCLC